MAKGGKGKSRGGRPRKLDVKRQPDGRVAPQKIEPPKRVLEIRAARNLQQGQETDDPVALLEAAGILDSEQAEALNRYATFRLRSGYGTPFAIQPRWIVELDRAEFENSWRLPKSERADPDPAPIINDPEEFEKLCKERYEAASKAVRGAGRDAADAVWWIAILREEPRPRHRARAHRGGGSPIERGAQALVDVLLSGRKKLRGAA